MTQTKESQSARSVPGPSGVPVLGNVRDFTGERPQDFLMLFRKYGNVVHLTFGPRHTYCLFGVDEIKHVVQDNNKNYTKGRALSKSIPLLGRGLLTSEGDFWRKQRRMIQPMFNRQKIKDFVPDMVDVTEEMLTRWQTETEPGKPFNVAREMMRLTLEVISRTMFGTGLRPEEADTVARVMPDLMHETNLRMMSLLPLREKLPTSANRRFQENIAALEAIVYRMINERRKLGIERQDLLGMLMAAREEGQPGMTDQQLRDEVMTIFLAGHETTASLLSWTFYALSLDPSVRLRLEEEVDRVVGDRLPAMEDLEALDFNSRVIDETLRLYPPAWAFARQAIADDVVGGYEIPAGAGIMMSPYVTHRHPDYWDNPEGFDPDRWLPERSQNRPHYAYIPFGGGPRMCVGNNFALAEANLVLAMVTRRYRLDLAPGYPVTRMSDFTFRPGNGIWVTRKER